MKAYFVFYCQKCFKRNASWKVRFDSEEEALLLVDDLVSQGYIADVWCADFDTGSSSKIYVRKEG